MVGDKYNNGDFKREKNCVDAFLLFITFPQSLIKNL